jgi:predicted ATPase
MQPTNWYVITGAPCSGKTAVIQGLERKGFPVVHEVARTYIDDELKKGRGIDEVKADIRAFERHVLNKKIEIEASLAVDTVIFLDRAVPDSIAYYRFSGLDPEEPLVKSRTYQYKKIFLFERLLFEKDRVRSENENMAAELEILLVESYRMLGYSPVRVPLLPVGERVDFILKRI